jgi:hypothetical protein
LLAYKVIEYFYAFASPIMSYGPFFILLSLFELKALVFMPAFAYMDKQCSLFVLAKIDIVAPYFLF